MITTVLGEIEESKLGVTSPHEHIFIDMRCCVDVTGNEPARFHEKIGLENRVDVFEDPYAVLDNALLEGVDDAVSELEYYRSLGGNTVIDCTPDEIGRDPLALKEVSERSGVNIILGCITPPCAPLLYLASRLSNTPVSAMIKPTMFFIATVWLPALLLVTFIPELSLTLPGMIAR